MSPLKRIGLILAGIVSFVIFVLTMMIVVRSGEEKIDGRCARSVVCASWKELRRLAQGMSQSDSYCLSYEFDAKERRWSFKLEKGCKGRIRKRETGEHCGFCMVRNKVGFRKPSTGQEAEDRGLDVFMFPQGGLVVMPRAYISSWDDYDCVYLCGDSVEEKIESLKRVQCSVLELGVIIYREANEVLGLKERVYRFSTWVGSGGIPHLYLRFLEHVSSARLGRYLKADKRNK